jgi:uncharacterized protein (TIGR02001 family)
MDPAGSIALRRSNFSLMYLFRHLFVGVAMYFAAQVLHGQAPAIDDTAQPERAWTITHAVTSQYLFRGVRLEGAAYQPSLDYTAGALSLGVWSSVALSDHHRGDADPEVDFYGAYSFSSSSGVFDVTPGVDIYTYPDADRSTGQYSATFEPSLAANILVSGIRFTPKIYYDLTLEGATVELSAAYALPLTTLGTELDFSASVGTFKWKSVTAGALPPEKNWGDYGLLSVSVPYQISAKGKAAINVTYSEGRNNFYKQAGYPKQPNEDAIGRVAVTLSYAISY